MNFPQQSLFAGIFGDDNIRLLCRRKTLACVENITVQIAAEGETFQCIGVVSDALTGVVRQHISAFINGSVSLKCIWMRGISLTTADKGNGNAECFGKAADKLAVPFCRFCSSRFIIWNQNGMTSGFNKSWKMEWEILYRAWADAEF